MKHTEFHEWLITTKPTTIIFEACGMSNYWKQTVRTAYAMLTQGTDYKADLLPKDSVLT